MEKKRFDPSQVHAEPKVGEPRVVKLDFHAASVVNQFHFGKILREGEGNYESVRDKFGALAATDEHVARAQRDSRFSVNPLLREPLSIEQEERRVIEERVEERIRAVREAAEKAGKDAGYEEGIKLGTAEGNAVFQKEAAESLASFRQLLAELDEAKSKFFHTNEQFLMETIFKISKMVLLRELKTDQEYLLRLATEVIEKTGLKDHIHIKISPGDSLSLDLLKKGLEGDAAGYKNLTLETSTEVTGGGCIIETDWNAINASLDTQLNAIHDALIGAQAGTQPNAT